VARIRLPPVQDSQAVQRTAQLNRMVQIIGRVSRMGKTIAAQLLVRDNRTTIPKRVRALPRITATCRDRVVQTTVVQITMLPAGRTIMYPGQALLIIGLLLRRLAIRPRRTAVLAKFRVRHLRIVPTRLRNSSPGSTRARGLRTIGQSNLSRRDLSSRAARLNRRRPGRSSLLARLNRRRPGRSSLLARRSLRRRPGRSSPLVCLKLRRAGPNSRHGRLRPVSNPHLVRKVVRHPRRNEPSRRAALRLRRLALLSRHRSGKVGQRPKTKGRILLRTRRTRSRRSPADLLTLKASPETDWLFLWPPAVGLSR